ncbi:tRNA (carboxymethyluridine(34)-5-O)-methyltransferase alkbh8-like [Brevipalpus obovatus]|uniref:tRNA (carboxymethyluridine(34)-5-O)-methyltransferase alkbh8-like n=1 Tax=Brevipalpus obovatus TaxID=246614 RepID=UPI003D9E5161
MSFEDGQEKEDSLGAHRLEDEYVLKVYDQIACDFDRTRYKPWPKVNDYIRSLLPGSILVDIGCGNGKYFTGISRHVLQLGCDTSVELLEICRKRDSGSLTNSGDCEQTNYYNEVVASNVLSLPLRNGSVDHCICIAVLHHLASPERRLEALREIFRILRPGGTCLIYVWAMEQERGGTKSKYMQKSTNSATNAGTRGAENTPKEERYHGSLPIHTNRTQFKHQDLLVPWKLKADKGSDQKEYLRYYHIFKEGELESLLEKISGTELIQQYFDQGNWCIVFKKQS